MDTLTLYVRGRAGNDASHLLYVGIEDSTGQSAIVQYPDPSILASTTWTEWTIPLDQFAGVKATAIKKMVIGVGDRSNPQPNGSGLLFIDDIRVTRAATTEAPAP